jgi:hypothetical protein
MHALRCNRISMAVGEKCTILECFGHAHFQFQSKVSSVDDAPWKIITFWRNQGNLMLGPKLYPASSSSVGYVPRTGNNSLRMSRGYQ